MKKMIIAIIVLLILSAGSLTAFFAVKKSHDKEAEKAAEIAADYMLFRFNSDNITNVTISADGRDYSAERDLSTTEIVWNLVNVEEFKADSEYFQNVCTYLSDLTAETDYGEATDENKSMYGLDDPIKITASDGTNEYVIYVGDPSPTGEYYYVMTGNKSKIYAINSLYGSVLKTSRTMMKSKDLVVYGDDEVSSVKIIRGGETAVDLNLDINSNTWTLPDDYSLLTVDDSAVTAMITLITRTEVQSFYDENLQDLSKYGFDNPYAELIVSAKDGRTSKRLFSYYGNDTDTYVYVLFEETGQVATFYAGDNDYIKKTPRDFIVDEVYNMNLMNVDTVQISYNGRSDLFTVDNESSSVSMNGTDLKEYGSDAYDSFSMMYNSIVFVTYSTVDVSAQPEYTDPILSCDFRLADGSAMLYELIPYSDTDCAVFMNGEFTGGFVSLDSITGKNTLSALYDKFIGIVG